MNDEYNHVIKLNGVHGFVFSVKNDGRNIVVSGWNRDHHNYSEGDKVLFVEKDGTETRYRIDEVEHCFDPTDMYFIHCTFFPRQNNTGENK